MKNTEVENSLKALICNTQSINLDYNKANFVKFENHYLVVRWCYPTFVYTTGLPVPGTYFVAHLQCVVT